MRLSFLSHGRQPEVYIDYSCRLPIVTPIILIYLRIYVVDIILRIALK